MVFNEFGKLIAVNPVQFWNAQFPMLVRLFGSVIEEIPVHPENAELPIVFNVDGRVTFWIYVQFSNIEPGIDVIPSGTTTDVSFLQL